MGHVLYRVTVDCDIPRLLFKRFRDGVGRAGRLEHYLHVGYVSVLRPSGIQSDRVRILADIHGGDGQADRAEDIARTLVMLACRRISVDVPVMSSSVETVPPHM